MNAFKRVSYLTFIILIVNIISSCKKQIKPENNSYCQEINEPCLDGKINILIKTINGDITLELDGTSAPITAGNFLDLINKGFYKGSEFHRVIKSPYPFIVQAGKINRRRVSDANSKNSLNYIKKQESSALSNLIPLEIKLKDESKPRYNSLIINPNELSLIQLPHKRGSLAMARAQAINSASTQFYITLKSLPELDGRYAVFGRVIKGMNIVESIEQGDKIIQAYSIIDQHQREK